MTSILTWKLVDDTAVELGVNAEARLKWRQRGVPAKWRIAIQQNLMQRSLAVPLGDFDALPLNPGRIAA